MKQTNLNAQVCALFYLCLYQIFHLSCKFLQIVNSSLTPVNDMQLLVIYEAPNWTKPKHQM